jgi:hypothetical protein
LLLQTSTLVFILSLLEIHHCYILKNLYITVCLLHSCSLVIYFCGDDPYQMMKTHSSTFKSSSLKILCRAIQSSVWKVFAVYSWYIAVLHYALLCLLAKVCVENGTLYISVLWSRKCHTIPTGLLGFWTFLSHSAPETTSLTKNWMSCHLYIYKLIFSFMVINVVFVVDQAAQGHLFLWVHQIFHTIPYFTSC